MHTSLFTHCSLSVKSSPTLWPSPESLNPPALGGLGWEERAQTPRALGPGSTGPAWGGPKPQLPREIAWLSISQFLSPVWAGEGEVCGEEGVWRSLGCGASKAREDGGCLRGGGEVEVVRQPADILLPWRAGQDLLMEAGLPAPLLGLQARDVASTSGWALRASEERVVDPLDEELGGQMGWASEMDFSKDCGPCSCPHPSSH